MKSAPSIWISLFVVAAVSLCACSSAPTRDPYAYEKTYKKVWPEKPEKARIEYVQTIRKMQDLGITRGIFARVADFFTGHKPGGLVKPMAVAVTDDGDIYVADPGAPGVHHFSQRRGSYRLIQRAAKETLVSPVGLAVDAQHRVYVTDSQLAKVFVIDPKAKTAQALNLRTELLQPTGIGVDRSRGWIHVVDTGCHQVKVFDAEGYVKYQYGERGAAAGEFNYPTMLWPQQQGRWLLTDSLNFRVQQIDSKGKVVGGFGSHGNGSGNLARPKGIASDSYGHIYVIDSLFHVFQIFDNKGRFLLKIGGQGRAPGKFWLPNGIFITKDNQIYVADSFNKRVQVFKYIGDSS